MKAFMEASVEAVFVEFLSVEASVEIASAEAFVEASVEVVEVASEEDFMELPWKLLP